MKFFGLSGRLVRSVAALSLPTVCIVALGFYFLINEVPSIVRNEQQRVRGHYRQIADEMRTNPEAAVRLVRGKGGFWAKNFTLRPGYWGTVPAGNAYDRMGTDPAGMGTDPAGMGTVPEGKVLVWYVDGKDNCIGKFVEIEAERDFFLIFWIGGPFFLFVLCGMTFVGIRYFVEYVKARDDFLAATAHDLTTPLVGMRYMIGRSDDDVKVLNERMIRLVENIKDFMKLGGRRPKARREPFDILKAYGEAYALFRDDYRDLFDGKDVDVEVVRKSPPPAPPIPPVIGDETMTVQILWNLLGNDLKYAAPHGSVRVKFAADGMFVRVEFIDEGPGMTSREMRRAFDRYYRAKTVLQSGKGGFGIGLCAAREFAEEMGGSLDVRANNPHGCIFTLRLPRFAGAR